MKRIKIQPKDDFAPVEQIGVHKGMYPVFIYWNKTYHFNSKRKALRFIAIVNQFYTRSMYKARLIYIDILNKYHRDWGYFEDYKSGTGSCYQHQRKCESALNAIQDAFNIMSERSDWANGSYIAINKFFLIISLMHESIDVIRQMNLCRNSTMDLYILDKLTDDVLMLENSLKCFGDMEAKYLNKPAIHKPALPVSLLESQKKLQVA